MTTFIKTEHYYAPIVHFDYPPISSFRLIINQLKTFRYLSFDLIGFKGDFAIDFFQKQTRTQTLFIKFKYFTQQLKIALNDGS